MAQPVRLSSLTATRAASFEQPFEMMEACHERMQRTLVLLGKLRAQLREHGADDQAQQAARDIIRYFDQAAPEHHRDEELHVFPPLLAQGDATTVEVVMRLQRDHMRMEGGWHAARAVLLGIAEARPGALAASADATLEGFAAIYESHIADEETIAYPCARKLLDSEAVKAMGDEMRQRRGPR